MNRRRFVDRLGQALAGVFALGAVVPAISFWWRPPKLGSGEDSWVDLGSAHKIPEGEWLQRPLVFERRDRWRLEQARELVYLRRDGRSFKVLSATCPHTGCLVRRQSDGFTCPCHQSFFDSGGRSVAGPSPRDLDELEWKVERRRLKVKFQRFRPGLAEAVVLAG